MTQRTSKLPLLDDESIPLSHRDHEGSITHSIASSFNVNKYFCLFDILPVLCWIPVACLGSAANTIIHFIFTIFYSMSVNSSKIFSNRKSKSPFLIFIFSLVYSLLYIIGQLSMYFLTKAGTIKSLPPILKYFDVYTYSQQPNLTKVFYIFIGVTIVDIIYIPITLLVSDAWFKRAKAALLTTMSRVILVIFLIDLSLVVSFSPHKYLLFMPILFGIACLLVGLCKNSFNYKVAIAFWLLFIIALFAFLLLIASDFVLTIEFSSIPRWARILTVCIASYIASLYFGNSLSSQSSTIRIVSKYRPPFFISGFAPFIVIVSSIFFSLCELTWVSFVGLIAGLIPSFFGNKQMALIVPYTFLINVFMVISQLFMCCFSSRYRYLSDITLTIPFVLTALSSLFLSNANGNYFRTEEKELLSALVASEKPDAVSLSAPVIKLETQTNSRNDSQSELELDHTQINSKDDSRSELELDQTQDSILKESAINQNQSSNEAESLQDSSTFQENANFSPASSAPVIHHVQTSAAPRAYLSKVQNVFGVFLLLAFYTMASIFASMYPSILTNVILFFSVIFAICGFFNKLAWRLLMTITSISALSQMMVTLLIRFYSFIQLDEKMYNLFFIPIDPQNDPIYKGLWPIFVLFFLALLIKSIFLSPFKSIVIIFNSLIPILVVLPIIFIENSVFNIAYLILFTVLMHLIKYSPNRGKKTALIVYGFVAFLNISVLILYSFKDFRKLPISSTVRIILGLPPDGTENDHIEALLVLTYYLLIISFTFKFETVDEQRTKPKFYDLILAILSLFTFYFFIIAVFIAVIVNHTSSLVYILILAVMGTVRIFTDKGQIAGSILYYIFLICYLFQTLVVLIPSSDRFYEIANYIGPAVLTKLGRGVNVITLMAAFSFSIVTQGNYQFNETLLKVAHFFRRNILVLVQISLSITAIEATEVLAPISAVILLYLSLKHSIGKILATILNIIMILLIIYVLFFMMMPYAEVDNVTRYFMLNEVGNIDVCHSFLHLLTCTLLLEFGINETPGFGPTVLTSYAFPIFAPIIMILSSLVYDYISMVHTILFMIIIILCMVRHRNYYYLIFSALMITIATIFFSTLRHTPWFPKHEILDKIFVFDRKYVVHRILIFIHEFILVTMIRSKEFKEVQDRENTRRNYRLRRQEIFAKIHEKDENFISIYFHLQLRKLQGDFLVLAVEGSYVPYPATKKDYYLINGIPYTSDETEVTEENISVGKKVLKALGSVIATVVNYIVDLINWALMLVIDYNLEPRMSLPAVQQLSTFYDVMINQYRRTGSLDIPPEWSRFAQTIPYSFKQHFKLISRLHIQKNRRGLRYQLFRRYITMFIRSIFPTLLVVLSLFYPFVQSSIIGFISITIVFICIQLKIHSYMPYFFLSIIVMFVRFFVQLPYIDELLINFSKTPKEQQRSLPVLSILGLSNLSDVFTYDAFLLYFSVLSVAFLYRHPATPNRCVDHKFFSRITNRSPYRINFPVYIFLIDFIGFLILFFGYGIWSRYETNIMSMVSGTSSISTFYVALLFIYMSFMLAVHISYLAKSPISLFIISLLFALISFSIIMFAIPHISKMQCWVHSSYNAFILCRLIAQFFICCQMSLGFPHEPPQISKGKPLFIIIYEVVFRACPFLFEIVVVMKWIANKTSVTLFNTLILEHVKSKLKQRRATSMLFPPRKQRGSCVGFLFLILMIFLLFFPLLLLSSSDSTTTVNPASIIDTKFGVAGISSFYEYLTTVEHSRITNEQQKQIFNMNDTTLQTYYTQPTQQIQVIDFPFSSMSEFIVTPDARRIAITDLMKNQSEFIPFGTISLSFKTATTKSKARNVVFNIFGDKLNETEKKNLSDILSNKSLSTATELRINRFIPMFTYVPYDNENSFISNYFYDAIFELTSSSASNTTNGASDYWHLKTVPSDPDKTPKFIKESYSQNVTRIVLWSQATPTKLIGSLLTSTGGIIGLYAFIVITIGQFITMWVAGLFTDLWIMRMHNPVKMLNALMAIESYRLEGDLDKEFELAEMVLENLRSTPRIIQLTDITNANIDQNLVEHKNRFDARNRRYTDSNISYLPNFANNSNLNDNNDNDNDNNNHDNDNNNHEDNNNNNHDDDQPLSESSNGMDL